MSKNVTHIENAPIEFDRYTAFLCPTLEHYNVTCRKLGVDRIDPWKDADSYIVLWDTWFLADTRELYYNHTIEKVYQFGARLNIFEDDFTL